MKKISTLILRNSLLLLATLFTISTLAQAQTKLAAPRLTQAIDDTKLVKTKSKVHMLARAEFDRGVVADSQPMNRMMLVLQRSPEQEAALRNLMDEQQTKNSPNYHAFLTPAQFGQQFGVADADIQKITAWLSEKGFTGIKASPGSMFVEFNGTAGTVRNAFHTQIHSFMVHGEQHMANVSVPQIPAALASVVRSVHSLHNFRKKSFLHYSKKLQEAKAKFGSNLTYSNLCPDPNSLTPGTQPCGALTPADFAKIYNLPTTLDGTGQTIALVARSNVAVSDINQFGTLFGIPNLTNFSYANNVVLTGPDPGVSPPDDGEATLDVEWSGAVAPNAKILLVVSDIQASTVIDGTEISAFYIVTNNLAPIMSESFGSCEFVDNDGFDNAIWEQAAAQGITVMVSTGDTGSAACDPDGFSNASDAGLQISGTASTPFNVAVGGTDFDDVANPSTYWNTTTGATGLSAKSYIPETTWNGGCASTATAGTLNSVCSAIDPNDPNSPDLAGGGGGQSNCGTVDVNNACQGYPKPAWQQLAGLTGMPADNVRDIPDVSLFAAVNTASSHFYVFCLADSLNQNGQPCSLTPLSISGVGGTSAASPAFAGIMALVNQSEVKAGRLAAGKGQGNANYVLYKLAAAQNASPGTSACNSSLGPGAINAACTFNDITKGNNAVPCVGSFGGTSVLGLSATPNCSTAAQGAIGVLVEPSSPAPFTATTPGFTTTAGYDLATGLGSVNVSNLVANWGSVTSNFLATTSTITSTVPATVNVTHGSQVTFNVSVTATSGTPTGDVSVIAQPAGGPQFSLGGATLSNSGVAQVSTLQLPGGTYPVVVHYAGDGTFAASDSAPVSVTVSKENSSTAVTMFDYTNFPSNGVPVTTETYGGFYLFRVDVIGSINGDNQECLTATNPIPCPTGTVTLTRDGGTPLNDFLNAITGVSTNSTTLNPIGFAEDRILGSNGLTGGTHTIVAAYAGDSSYNASTSPAASVTITPASTITGVTANGSSAATVIPGQQVTLMATVAGCVSLTGSTCNQSSNGAGPTGSVTFSTCGSASSCQVTVVPVSFANSGSISNAFATATLTTTFATTGVQTIKAAFTTADTNYIGCSAAACEIGSAVVTVNATAGAATKVVFTTQPSNTVAGASITPAVKVTVEDANGSQVAAATNAITIALGTNPASGTLAGTVTANAVNGIATFSNLSINNVGTGYTLTASAAGLTPATSTPFNITSAATAAFTISSTALTLNSGTGASSTSTITVNSQNGFNSAVTVSLPTSLPPGVSCTAPAAITPPANGTATGTLSCQVTATSATLTASNLREDRVLDAKLVAPKVAVPPATGGKGWWALSAGTGFAAMFLFFLPGGRKKYRAALGLSLACILAFTLGCGGGSNSGGGGLTATVTKLTVTSGRVASGTAFSFSVSVTGGTPGGSVQLFDNGVMIGTPATVASGTAAPTAPALSVGTHSISAHYLGDSKTMASQSGSLNLTVTGATTIAITTTPAATPAAPAVSVTIN